MKFAGFRLLEAASHLRRPPPRPSQQPHVDADSSPGERSLWIYVTTVGELNAIEPFLVALMEALKQPALTLITNHAHYGDAYRAKYPQAQVEVLQGSTPEVDDLLRRRPPCLLVVAEIPCLLHDAPCRFSYATVRAVRASGAPVVLVNGWLYNYAAASRMDAIETHLFGADYVRSFDLMLVQTEEVRQRLLQHGALPEHVLVTGNIKFDAMQSAASRQPDGELLDALRARPAAPRIVAGSVTELADQSAILVAFSQVLAQHPSACLILAPRHPENLERMQALRTLLATHFPQALMRSECTAEQAAASQVLILDTIGELRGCYSLATLAYVGTDHNLLEPLAFGKPVYTSGRWEPTYPSYPVYLQLTGAGAVHLVPDVETMGALWVQALAAEELDSANRLQHVLASARGATERCMKACSEHRVLDRALALAAQALATRS